MAAPRQVALGSTITFKFNTVRFSTGAPFTLAGTPVISVYEESNTTQITAGVSLSVDYDSVTGYHEVTVVATAANGYEAGKTYEAVITTGTVDSVSVVGMKVYEFTIETAAQAAQRVYAEKVYLTHLVTTTTGNTTGRINLTDFLDAQTADGDLVGSVWDVVDITNDQWQRVVVVSVQSARLFNVVVQADGSALDFTVAAGDMSWFVGWDSLRATVPGRTLGVSATGDADADINKINGATITGDGDGTPFDVA